MKTHVNTYLKMFKNFKLILWDLIYNIYVYGIAPFS